MVAYITILAMVFATLASTSTQAVAQPVNELTSRQVPPLDASIFPEQCSSQCSALVDTISSGSCIDLDCICGTRFSSAMADCLRCGISDDTSQIYQDYYRSYSDSCQIAGKSVPNFSATSSTGNGGNNAISRSHLTVGLVGTIGVGLLLVL